LDRVKAGDIMSFPVLTIRPEATIRELADVLGENDVSGLPVVDDEGRLLGVVSEEDLILQDAELHFPHYIQIFDSVIYLESIRKFEERFRKALAVKVRDIMSDEPVTISTDATLREIATIMIDRDVNRLPVVDEENRLLGIVARGDVIRGIAALQALDEKNEKGAEA